MVLSLPKVLEFASGLDLALQALPFQGGWYSLTACDLPWAYIRVSIGNMVTDHTAYLK
ncbi:uncharacterized protein BDZ99DRAFT_266329 [Mytilinidion resinicola]|uniref:Uncharacterized protein n=1 Tax=Mytilinidion resinicola TaxID=574789 RepID=A0A6A6YUI6_9PEZI|nr:uncharacterized protein BDZ99DRAFT_266329 [Mytilinidion resinicola]KAF2812420.1 hypothetical protein BDZ99DRAFT_266329 [Mytilinidion resinicola]